MNTSILNPFGSLSCGVGNLSAAMGKGGGLMPRSLVAASEVGWLGVGGGGVGVDCWAAAGKAASALASVAASNSARCGEKRMSMRSSLIVRLLGRSVRQVVPQAQSESGIRIQEQNEGSRGGRLMIGAHAAVDVGSVAAHGREFGDPGLVGSEMAHRIGCGGIAGEREGLAAAAAEIELATRTARARLLHPRGAAEGVEGRRVCPDIGERTLAHVPEFKTGTRLGGVAGQHLARRRHVERAPTPAADARLWIAGIVVRHHGVDDDATVVTRAQ